MYCVPVTFGNRNQELYARGIQSRQAAEKLRDAALERGYSDARIEREADFRAAQRAQREGGSYSGVAA